jgi:hypothetical protein
MKIKWEIVSLVLTLIIVIAGISVGYGSLTNRVEAAEKEVNTLRSQYDIINTKLDDIRERLTGVETKIEIHMDETNGGD